MATECHRNIYDARIYFQERAYIEVTSTELSLRRSRSNRMVAGVCGGPADFFGVNAFWFRLAFLIALIDSGHDYENNCIYQCATLFQNLFLDAEKR
jgi:hypothetical protein